MKQRAGVVLLISILLPAALAQAAALTLSGPDGPIRVGDTFEVEVRVSGSETDLWAAVVEFDPSSVTGLTLLDAVSPAPAGWSASRAEGPAYIDRNYYDDALGVTGNFLDLTQGPVLVGSFTVRADAVGLWTLDANGNSYVTSFAAGDTLLDPAAIQIEVLPPLVLGDFDGDGDVDFWDLIAFVSVYGLSAGDPGWEPNGPIADFNNDGRCDFWDVIEFIAAFGA